MLRYDYQTHNTHKKCPTNLTDSQRRLLDGILQDDRKRKHSLRDVLDALFYLIKTGCQWRMLPHCFPKWELVYYYFSKRKNDGTIELIHELLRDKVRKNAGKHESPSLACIDSQSIKTTRIGGECRGIDGGKKIIGRKRHIITDTMGLLLAVVIHPANVHDSKGASDVITSLKGRFCRLIKIIADSVIKVYSLRILKPLLAGYLKLYCERTIQESLPLYPNVGLSKERLLGLKATEGSVKILNSIPILLKL